MILAAEGLQRATVRRETNGGRSCSVKRLPRPAARPDSPCSDWPGGDEALLDLACRLSRFCGVVTQSANSEAGYPQDGARIILDGGLRPGPWNRPRSDYPGEA